MNIEYVKTGSVKPYDKNPRRNDDSVEFVANSIKEFGFQQPIVVTRIWLLSPDTQDLRRRKN